MFPSNGFGNYSPEELLEMGLDFYGLGRFEDAMACWEQVLALDSTNAQALDYLKTARIELVSRKAAEPLPAPGPQGKLVTFRQANPPAESRSEQVELSLEKARQSPAAISTEEQAPAVETFEALYQKAMYAYVRRNLGLAKSLFEKCLALRPDDRRVQHNLKLLNRTSP